MLLRRTTIETTFQAIPLLQNWANTHYHSVNEPSHTLDQVPNWQKAIQKLWWGSKIPVLLGIATLTEVAITSHFWVLINREQNKNPNSLNSLIPGNLLLTSYFYLRYHGQYFFVDIIRICHLKWGISLRIGLHVQANVFPSVLKDFDIALFWGQICKSWIKCTCGSRSQTMNAFSSNTRIYESMAR